MDFGVGELFVQNVFHAFKYHYCLKVGIIAEVPLNLGYGEIRDNCIILVLVPYSSMKEDTVQYLVTIITSMFPLVF